MNAPADDLRTLDAAARARAQRELEAPLVLEAGAGTGKTATLVARILAWSLGPGWERAVAALDDATDDAVAARVLSRTVAITFTDAAAAEMATRVEQALLAVEQGEAVVGLDAQALPDEASRRPRAAALRDALDHLVVQTLHAYARRLLTAHPFEASLHPRLEVDADGLEQESVVRRVLEDALRRAYAEGGDALALAADGHGPHELEQELRALLDEGVRAADLAGDPVSDERLAALLGRVREALSRFREAEQGVLSGVKRGGVTFETLDLLGWLETALARDAPAAETLGDLTSRLADAEKPIARLKAWAQGRFNKGEGAALGDREGAVAAAAAHLAPLLAHVAALRLDALRRAARLLAGLLAEVEAELSRRGIATFATLLSDAAALLERRPDVAAAIRRDVDQRLVDEFQDTDPQQCAIVAALALPEGGGQGERPGLFLVGDPKQSIYGWRDADLAAYEAFVARALAQGGELHRLSVNMRSLPAVLDEVERVIRPVMRREAGVQPAFEPLVPSERNAGRRFEAGERFAGVEYWVAADWDAEAAAPASTSAGDATRREARALAHDLAALHREGVPWSDVGVLFRSRGDWDVYLTALREANVPFAVEGDRSYYRRREIIDASCWVRCVLDRNDRLAVVGALRSVVVGVPDAAWRPLESQRFLERVARLGSADPAADDAALGELEEQVGRVVAALPGDVPGLARVAGWERNLLAALRRIAALRVCFDREPADVFVETLRESLWIEASEAARFLGPWRVANLERFFRDLTERLAAGDDTHAVLRALRHAVAEEEEMEEEPPHDAASDAVQILTLHGAKGLDFEHVYLMQLHKGTGERPPPRLDAARVDGRLELRLLGVPTLGFDRAAARRRQVGEAEHVRLLYGGMTRAKRRLVLSGAWSAFLTRAGGLRHVDLLAERPGLPSAERLAEALRGGGAHFDEDGARFVVPALRGEEASAPSPRRSTPGDAPPLRPEEDARRRREAALRMQRPLGAARPALGALLRIVAGRPAGRGAERTLHAQRRLASAPRVL
ncbi:MAG: UvrD-helicase domain-containing protein, partial [Myxococcota bacterium]